MDFLKSSPVWQQRFDCKARPFKQKRLQKCLRNAFINAVLGYDVFDPLEVMPEFVCDVGTKKGEKIDYAIMKDGEVQILIECKRSASP